MITTEFQFVLPQGLVDAAGQVHREGVMRLTTARDEMMAAKSPKVQENPAYESIFLLSQVIVQLGSIGQITPVLLENLFSVDFSYLKEFYHRINQQGNLNIPAQCPKCQQQFETALLLSGES
jgi:hypothetical protein